MSLQFLKKNVRKTWLITLYVALITAAVRVIASFVVWAGRTCWRRMPRLCDTFWKGEEPVR